MIFEALFRSRFWQSIFRHGLPIDEKNRALTTASNVFLHLHPVKVRKHGLKFTYTWGLGGLSLLFFAITLITGIFLMFYYTPSVERAYQDMKDLEFAVFFGLLMRNLHRWTAHGMVLAVFLHMIRIFYTGSYKAPREFNWMIGMILLVITLALSYTGYLLPWDQLAYWAVTVGTNIAGSIPYLGEHVCYLLRGGNIIGQNALLRFYVLHCIVLPLVLCTFLAVHFWRIRKDGGISGPPYQPETGTDDNEALPSTKTYGLMGIAQGYSPAIEKQPDDTVMSWPHLVFRETTFAVLVVAAFLLFSYFFNAPLEELANPEKTPSPAKAPWYFLWIQEIVSWTHPFLGGVLAPSLVFVLLLFLPYYDKNPRGVGIWFAPERKVVIIVFTILVAAIIITSFIGTFCRGPGWEWFWPWEHWEAH